MKNLKTILSLILVMGMAFSLQAQNIQEEPSWKETLTHHDFQFGVGDPALLFLNNVNIHFGCYNPYGYTSADSWFTHDYVNTLTFAAPSLNFEYHYRCVQWFCVGGALSFTPVVKLWENVEKGDKFASHMYYISIMPSARFSWLNLKYITLYSGLAAGCMVATGGKFDPEERVARQITEVHFAGQLTAVGIQAGKNWYGFTEIGVGVQGFVRAGFGYKFQSKGNKNE